MIPGFEDVATFTDGGGGYEWQEMHVYRSCDGRLFGYAESGCSCNSYDDPGSAAQLVELPTLRAAHDFWAAAIDWNNSVERWLDDVQPDLMELGLR